MGNGQWVWFLAGAAAVLFALVVFRVLRRLGARQAQAIDDYTALADQGGQAGGPTPGGSGFTPSSGRVEAPYGIDKRPMPVGDDLDALLPGQVGPYVRTKLRPPSDIHSDPIYATYRAGASEVFMELGICRSAAAAQMALATAKAETTAEGDTVVHAWSCGTEPSFLKDTNPRLGAFLAWTRGGYYYSAHANGGEADLDAFMKGFPY